MEQTKKKVGRPRKERRGGAREGAGRKKGVQIKENPLTEHVTFRTHADTLRRVQLLRDLTKRDELSFNRLFEQWVEGLAQEYGIE